MPKQRQYGRQPAHRHVVANGHGSITSFAEEMGVTRTHFRNVLLGLTLPSENVRVMLPEILGVPLEELFTEEVLKR